MQKEDFEWYVANIKMLYQQYGKKYLAIKNKKVIGTYQSFDEGLSETLKNEKLGTFIIQKCGRDKRAYTLYTASNIIDL